MATKRVTWMAPTTQHSAILATVTQLAQDIEALTQPADVFAHVARAADACIGHQLLTVLRLDPRTMEVERLYTTNSVAYPTQGTKPMRDTWWGEHVLRQGQAYIGRDANDIRKHFADHEVILGLGLESILNIPVRVHGTTLGTVNLLNTAAFYHERHVGLGKLLGALIAPSLMQGAT